MGDRCGLSSSAPGGSPEAKGADEGCAAVSLGCSGFAFVPSFDRDAFQRVYRRAVLLSAMFLLSLVCFILP